MSDILTTEHYPAFRDIEAERNKQDAKWGLQNHPSVQPVPQRHRDDAELHAKECCEAAAAQGQITWEHIAVEEFCEALNTGSDDNKRREELVQLAAVIVAWIECIDRRKTS